MHDFSIEFLYSKFLQSDGVSIDTRTLKQDNLFFGIKGPNFDGGAYAQKALESAASFAIVQDQKYVVNDRIILVDNVEKSLQDLAKFHRSRFKRPVLALTGSNGKTTTKELIRDVLQKKHIVHATTGNLNNHLGVPLTLLHIYPQVEIAIVEMGANHVGEIAGLCEITNPTHGLITNIGQAHSETFGGFENIIRGKSELFDYLRKTDGTVLINMGDEVIRNMSKRFKNPITYPTSDLKLIDADPYLKCHLGEDFTTAIVGDYNFENVAAAVEVGRMFGVTDAEIREAIAAYRPQNMRSQLIKRDNLTVIMDAYNANPSSMKVSLENLSRMKGEKTAILGVMNEVQNPVEAHRELGKTIAGLGIDRVLMVGPLMKEAHEQITGSYWFKTKEELVAHLSDYRLEEGTVLIKASRSEKLETLLDTL